jgi:peptidoglycan hydrolase-like protein with peptidoglycan-binding domain
MTQPTLPTLQQGNSGLAVSLLQRLLVLYGYQDLLGTAGVDGIFGPNTKNAVVQFQRDQNIDPKDGIVGQTTWSQLAYPAGTQRPA